MDETNYVFSNDDQGRAYQIVNFMTHGAGVLMLGHGHIHVIRYINIVNMHYLLLYQYTAHQLLLY